MTYDTIVTSKGTITIAAPLRKAMKLRPGQKITMSLNDQHQIVLDSGMDMESFEKLRAEITKKIPDHLKGLSGDDLRKAAADAWVAGYNE